MKKFGYRLETWVVPYQQFLVATTTELGIGIHKKALVQHKLTKNL